MNKNLAVFVPGDVFVGFMERDVVFRKRIDHVDSSRNWPALSHFIEGAQRLRAVRRRDKRDVGRRQVLSVRPTGGGAKHVEDRAVLEEI